jgi:hypothetical protein
MRLGARFVDVAQLTVEGVEVVSRASASTAHDHDIGVPAIVSGSAVTAIENTRRRVGASTSIRATALAVRVPYRCGSFRPIGGRIFTDVLFRVDLKVATHGLLIELQAPSPQR